MQVTPRTEEQVMQERPEAGEKARVLLSEGEYDFIISKAEDKISQTSQNEMIELFVGIYTDGKAPAAHVFDHLVDTAKAAYKVRHAAFACGLGDKYNNGELVAADFVGTTGRCKIIVEKSKNPKYPEPKNKILDYIVPEDDGLPF